MIVPLRVPGSSPYIEPITHSPTKHQTHEEFSRIALAMAGYAVAYVYSSQGNLAGTISCGCLRGPVRSEWTQNQDKANHRHSCE